MFTSPFFMPFLGGTLIGLAASILYGLNGRIAGISGIFGRLLRNPSDRSWRLYFLGGLLLGSAILFAGFPDQFAIDVPRSLPAFGVAGILVGFGTQMANGCTSGHGVCGLSRFSFRSLAAPLAFMASAMLTVWLISFVWGGHI